jgi:hypothetical protein
VARDRRQVLSGSRSVVLRLLFSGDAIQLDRIMKIRGLCLIVTAFMSVVARGDLTIVQKVEGIGQERFWQNNPLFFRAKRYVSRT